jgi:antitoxin (DNA-binding transcriptional repressor) of toxin-antitoxin stability system
MKVAGVKELKARLSEYLRLVRAGETILVTDRDQVVAELRPPVPRPAPRGTVDDVLDGLAEQGEVSRAPRPKGDWTWRAKGLGLPDGTAAALLDELRGEGGGA